MPRRSACSWPQRRMTRCRARFGEMLPLHGVRRAMTPGKCRRWTRQSVSTAATSWAGSARPNCMNVRVKRPRRWSLGAACSKWRRMHQTYLPICGLYSTKHMTHLNKQLKSIYLRCSLTLSTTWRTLLAPVSIQHSINKRSNIMRSGHHNLPKSYKSHYPYTKQA